jgi:predicted esterase
MPPTLMFHGDRDDVVPLSDADHLAAFLRAHRFSVQYRVYAGEVGRGPKTEDRRPTAEDSPFTS